MPELSECLISECLGLDATDLLFNQKSPLNYANLGDVEYGFARARGETYVRRLGRGTDVVDLTKDLSEGEYLIPIEALRDLRDLTRNGEEEQDVRAVGKPSSVS